MKTAQWEEARKLLNSDLVDRAEQLRREKKLDHAEALLEAARAFHFEKMMELDSMNAQPFG